jgi:hypothetical protein
MKARDQSRKKENAPARSSTKQPIVASLSSRVAQPPRGWHRLLWLGPGFLWMVSAAGSAELLL